MSKDSKLSDKTIRTIQKMLNDHTYWLGRILGCGNNWQQEDRIQVSVIENSEVTAPMYLLIKDHKGWREESGSPPPSRPACEGNQGTGRHLSELISMVLEPLTHATQGDNSDRTGDMQIHIIKFKKLKSLKQLRCYLKSLRVFKSIVKIVRKGRKLGIWKRKCYLTCDLTDNVSII